ncbi:MAG: cobyric acid synthase CobQ [Sphingobacteriales bacterium 50-39]|nr:cobyric acid synthase [Sphingobacteriales bacterium]OJW56903.1 MAG: cobyric acid synthase CobQ [Sphingobacteriales bacterium 50-39]
MQGKKGLRSIMFVGTGSDVGKSVITTGFCRIFRQDGYTPAPFKAQNMSLNSYATPEGLEIGRAQAVQAEACAIPCHTDMNPVLLKPTTDLSAQVVLHGTPAGNTSAAEYFLTRDRETLFTEVKNAYHRLASRHTPIVMEGAGSISELNLKHLDITNMRMAMAAGAAAYLVADIDRGGVFGSCYGTMALLSPEERACIKGIIINKFRGDARLFDSGRVQLEGLCGVPVVGVVPYFRDIFIEEEDSISTTEKGRNYLSGKINIVVVLLQRLSNFTDFHQLSRDQRVNLYYSHHPDDIEKADIIILPGSKNTIEDLATLYETGVVEAIRRAHSRQKTIIGICGGYQMLGQRIDDPDQVESSKGSLEGIGILPVSTILQKNKTTLQRQFRFRGNAHICEGYEIHMGETRPLGLANPLNQFINAAGTPTYGSTASDGYYLNDRCWGTYLHGILDNAIVIDSLLARYTDKKGQTPDHRRYKEEQYDRLAALLREHLDIDYIYKTLKN